MAKKLNSPRDTSLQKVLVNVLGLRLFLLSLLVAIPFFFFSGYLHTISLEQEQYRAVNSVAARIDDFFLAACNVLQGLDTTRQSTDLQDLAYDLQIVQITNFYFDTIYIASPSGEIVAASPQSTALQPPGAFDTYSPIQTPALEQSFSISPPYFSPNSGKLTVAILMESSQGNVFGEISLDKLQNMFLNEPYIDRGLIFFADEHNIITGLSLFKTEMPAAQYQKLVRLAGESGVSQARFSIDPDQIYLESAVNTAVSGWIVVARVPILVAYGNYLFLLFIILVATFVLWIIWVSLVKKELKQKIVNPLTQLSENARTLADGDLSRRYNLLDQPATFQEIEQLATDFDRMSRSIQFRQSQIKESEHKYKSLIEESNDAICLLLGGYLEIINQRFTEMFGYRGEEINGGRVQYLEIVAAGSRAVVEQVLNDLFIGKVVRSRCEFIAIAADRRNIEVEASFSAFPYLGGIAIQSILRDVTERKRAERAEHEQRVLAESLRDTASLLNSNLNFDEVLKRILSNVGKVVPHDSSNIMLVDEDRQNARILASRDRQQMRPNTWSSSAAMPIFQTPSLKIMFETGKPIAISWTRQHPHWTDYPETRWIQSYAGAPIKVMDEVIGFLNLNSDKPNFFDHNLAERLQAFADQAGVALHNARLLQDLERSNQELKTAYGATLQGLSKALEIRDIETEGHSLRVVDLTLKLADVFHIQEPQRTYIHYGVLLHDIGKLGIPDAILHKPGPLTAEEWEVMRKHPEYGYQILSSIPYLLPSLEIPLYHHEKWDGSGYPKGLKGTEIPLSARIFSVVDVWDGLRSTRPYHASWPEDKVIQYIRDESGTSFDPTVVTEFLNLIG
ncbi:MAG: HD domain-containing protein [Chloroflexi bacterium]|nr:HD domain-containing phosphohydrolase [Anaerolineaceae bacterium]NMB89384.1 HD domain-containing protein [Chloroflexota bacterium]